MKMLIDTLVVAVLAVTSWYLYVNYFDDVQHALFGSEPMYTIYVGAKALEVTVADEDNERIQGLSGVKSLGDFNGKLFIFDTDGQHYIWMKDMYLPLDIIWVNKNLEIVHIEEQVTPETYPKAFTSEADARFVLEVNANFVSSVRVAVGDRLLLPPGILPEDISKNLQQ